jgi:hypothetical protein
MILKATLELHKNNLSIKQKHTYFVVQNIFFELKKKEISIRHQAFLLEALLSALLNSILARLKKSN